MRHPLLLLLLLGLVLLLTSCQELETFEPPVGEGPWVLVDLYHTRIQNPEDYRLKRGEFFYQGNYGYARAFDHLAQEGYAWRSIRELRLSKPRLKGFDVLFINLVHEERPDFDSGELEAIQEFVREGGGLFVISDHSNVYYHGERLNRLLKPMGIEVTYHTAVDMGPHSLSGLGWIAIEDFAEHPTNAGVELLGFQTGGPMRAVGEGAQATAFTSNLSFGDFWNEDYGAGFYGNWMYDEGEPRGPLPVVMTSTYGAGRVIVVGDQNIYGDAFLHFGDNFRHMMNAFEWLAQREETSATPLGLTRPAGVNIGIDLKLSERVAANGAPESYYTFFINFNRDPEVTGRALPRLDDPHDALVIPSPTRSPTQSDLEAIVDSLRLGRKVVLSLELSRLGEARYRPTIELLRQLAPDLTVEVGSGDRVRFNAETAAIAAQLGAMTFPELAGEHVLRSERLEVGGLRVGSWRALGTEENAPRESYLLDIASSWGEPLLETDSGATLARSKRMGAGELIVFLQDGFFRNRTLGSSESEPLREGGEAATALQYSLIDDLKKPLTLCRVRCGALPVPDLDELAELDPLQVRVLVDLYHTRKQNPEDYRLAKGLYQYQGTHGYARAFDHLGQHGYTWRSVRDGPLTAAMLERYDVLFINLLHDDRPDFSPEEREAIQAFVRAGGGLLLIGDHSNAYYHAERANRLLEPMGVEISYHTAIDFGPQQVTGLAWIAIETLAPHPVNAGIDMISFQTGGIIYGRGEGAMETARLSERGFGDLWDEGSGVGFYGNWRYDDDPALEPRGALPVGVAATYGSGRIVVAGDQNMFGDVWLHFGGNFKHWLNSYEWLAKREGATSPLRNTRPAGLNIGVELRASRYSPGNISPDNYYTFFVNLNRDPAITGRGLSSLDLEDDALILPPARRAYTTTETERIRAYLESGRRVVVLGEVSELGTQAASGTLDLLRELAPDMTLRSGADTIALNQPRDALLSALGAARWPRREGFLNLTSDKMKVEGMQVGSYAHDAPEGALPTMLEVTTSWGEPLLGSIQGIDVARHKRIGRGELVVFLQDAFWRNRTMGESEVVTPQPRSLPAIELQYRLMDYLKTPIT